MALSGDIIKLEKELEILRRKHEEMDEVIDNLAIDVHSSPFELNRMKRERLALKDQISKLEEVLYPDIVA